MTYNLKLISLLAGLIFFSPHLQAEPKPWQFISKLFTEALGRAPEPGEWNFYRTRLENTPRQNLIQVMQKTGYEFFTSEEYMNLNYDNASKLLTLYRGCLNREPDQTGFNYWLNNLNNYNITWEQTVNNFFNGEEFTEGPAVNSSGKPYYWNDAPVIDIGGGRWTQAYLEKLLKSGEKIISIPQKTVIALDHQLVIPGNIIIQTEGNPSANEYALMARFIGSSDFNDRLIKVLSNSTLQNIWIDGQLAQRKLYQPARANVLTSGGNITITNCRLSDPSGFSNILAGGVYEGVFKTEKVVISNNLITSYANNHDLREGYNTFADGISIGYHNTEVFNNSVIDATDAAIVAYKAEQSGKYHQSSKIYNNIIFNAGNSLGWGLAADPTMSWEKYNRYYDFTGTEFYDNVVWTSPGAYIAVVIAAGTRSLFTNQTFDPVIDYADRGGFAGFYNNTSGTGIVRCNIGIFVNGMQNADIRNNTFNIETEAFFGHKEGMIIANEDPEYASGNYTGAVLIPDSLLCGIWDFGYYIKGDNKIYAAENTDTTFRWEIAETYPADLNNWNWYYNDNLLDNNTVSASRLLKDISGKEPVDVIITIKDPVLVHAYARKWVTYYP